MKLFLFPLFLLILFSCNQINHENKPSEYFDIFLGLKLGQSRESLYNQLDSLINEGKLKETTDALDSSRSIQRFEFRMPLLNDTIDCEFILGNSTDYFYNNIFYRVSFFTDIKGNKYNIERLYNELLQLFYHKYSTPTEVTKELVMGYPEYHWAHKNLFIRHFSYLSEIVPLVNDKYAKAKALVVKPNDILKENAMYSKAAYFDYKLLNVEAQLKNKTEEKKQENERRNLEKKQKILDTLIKNI